MTEGIQRSEAEQEAIAFIKDLSADDAVARWEVASDPDNRHERPTIIQEAEQHERMARTADQISPEVLEQFIEARGKVNDDIALRASIDLSEHFETAEDFCRKFIAEAESDEWKSADLNALLFEAGCDLDDMDDLLRAAVHHLDEVKADLPKAASYSDWISPIDAVGHLLDIAWRRSRQAGSAVQKAIVAASNGDTTAVARRSVERLSRRTNRHRANRH
jgi:hypothetical protein